MGLWAGFGSFASITTLEELAGSMCYKCQVLGMVRGVMVGAGLAPAPPAFLGLQVPIPLGIPSL